MAALIAPADLLRLLDHAGSVWADAAPILGSSSGNPQAGTARGTLNDLLENVLSLESYEQETDLLAPSYQALSEAVAESLLSFLLNLVSAIDGHCSTRGSSVNASILSMATYLAFYNQTPFTALVTPEFAAMYAGLREVNLAPTSCMSPAIHPYAGTPTGMGSRAIGGAFVAGAAIDSAHYCEVIPAIEVTTTFVGGATNPTVSIAGTDDQGNTVSYGPVDLGTNNPSGPLSGVTITGVVVTHERQDVSLSSAAGVVVGSVLKINAGLIDEEVVYVEAVAGTTITAVFRKDHAAGATVSGFRTLAAGVPSTGSGRRLRQVTGITLAVGTHSAGAVRVAGTRDRGVV